MLIRSVSLVAAAAAVLFFQDSFAADEVPKVEGHFRETPTAQFFDVSPPLRDMAVIPPPDEFGTFFGSLMIDPDAPGKPRVGPQDVDRVVQGALGVQPMPPPTQNFAVGTGTANPPDPVGDVGPNHYVRMANASFQIFSKTGTSLFGPANINTLFSGFGGDCQNENAGDPIVLYDQLADRWLLTQFSDSNGPGFFNCVALSVSGDPLGSYFRWAFPTSTFPDYPKYGVWPNAYLISTREVNANQIGAYAIDRAQMLAGNPTPTVVSFVNDLAPGVAQFLGDGLLPADVDGSALPPPGSPAYYLAAMDDGGPYGATEDALAIWKFTIDFATPANSSFVLSSVLSIAPYDTIFPCVGRSCIPQPPPLGAVDILSYRQRPIHRAAYRNYGSYESIVTNQAVEAAPGLAGIRWWEVRSPGNNPVLYQDSTFAPGVSDGIHRWMGSIAADSSGNLALGYSASSSSLFPGIRYTGRLEHDELGVMAQGEGEFVAGGGGLTAGTRRWGDYTSMNVDPSDDCTFWYINEYFAASGTTWTLRAGAFKFPSCGSPSFGLAAVPLRKQICAPDDATFQVETHAYNGFSGAATLGASGHPAGTTIAFSPPTVASVPGNSLLTISNTGAAAAGVYDITVDATGGAPSATRSRSVELTVFSNTPAGPTLQSPADAATSLATNPLLVWTTAAQGQTYVAEVATDAAFSNIVFTSAASTATQAQLPPVLAHNTQYFWRARAINVCGPGTNSTVFTFTTRPAAGQCAVGQSLVNHFRDNMENGVNGWATDPVSGTTWNKSTARPFSGASAWLAVDVASASDQRLISPSISLPTGQNFLLLRFKHDVTMEDNPPSACFDGGFVEVSSDNGGTWAAIPATKVLEDFYDGPLSAGEIAWCGTQPYTTASLDIDDFAGQNVRFRFRAITDGSVGSVPDGWYIDDVEVVGCSDVFADGFE